MTPNTEKTAQESNILDWPSLCLAVFHSLKVRLKHWNKQQLSMAAVQTSQSVTRGRYQASANVCGSKNLDNNWLQRICNQIFTLFECLLPWPVTFFPPEIGRLWMSSGHPCSHCHLLHVVSFLLVFQESSCARLSCRKAAPEAEQQPSTRPSDVKGVTQPDVSEHGIIAEMGKATGVVLERMWNMLENLTSVIVFFYERLNRFQSFKGTWAEWNILRHSLYSFVGFLSFSSSALNTHRAECKRHRSLQDTKFSSQNLKCFTIRWARRQRKQHSSPGG